METFETIYVTTITVLLIAAIPVGIYVVYIEHIKDPMRDLYYSHLSTDKLVVKGLKAAMKEDWKLFEEIYHYVKTKERKNEKVITSLMDID